MLVRDSFVNFWRHVSQKVCPQFNNSGTFDWRPPKINRHKNQSEFYLGLSFKINKQTSSMFLMLSCTQVNVFKNRTGQDMEQLKLVNTLLWQNTRSNAFKKPFVIDPFLVAIGVKSFPFKQLNCSIDYCIIQKITIISIGMIFMHRCTHF